MICTIADLGRIPDPGPVDNPRPSLASCTRSTPSVRYPWERGVHRHPIENEGIARNSGGVRLLRPENVSRETSSSSQKISEKRPFRGNAVSPGKSLRARLALSQNLIPELAAYRFDWLQSQLDKLIPGPAHSF